MQLPMIEVCTNVTKSDHQSHGQVPVAQFAPFGRDGGENTHKLSGNYRCASLRIGTPVLERLGTGWGTLMKKTATAAHRGGARQRQTAPDA